jgi:hypothetical protein
MVRPTHSTILPVQTTVQRFYIQRTLTRLTQTTFKWRWALTSHHQRPATKVSIHTFYHKVGEKVFNNNLIKNNNNNNKLGNSIFHQLKRDN